MTIKSGSFGTIPLSLYIHIPWCVRKCPYCDFNSHAQTGELPINAYVDSLLKDLTADSAYAQGRPIESIFFGGGTPSLFPAQAIGQILDGAAKRLNFADNIEITLECNPGTAEYCDFGELRATGVNRLSFGAQSFNNAHLQTLGRIHSAGEITTAVSKAHKGGFDNYNIDLMHGLPNQSINQALSDLEHAIELGPKHISWYQLTIEPNTVFHSAPPQIPCDDVLADIYEAGQLLLAEQGFEQYEVSAYAKAGKASRHNMNYWLFGDYLGIGAGAHGKISLSKSNEIIRYQKTRQPAHYLDTDKAFISKQDKLATEALPLEFLMNAFRLKQGFASTLFEQRTGLALTEIEAPLSEAQDLEFIHQCDNQIVTTDSGFRFLNNLLALF